jgi:isopentenyldiphosphate isomerase/intracellular septation protein A
MDRKDLFKKLLPGLIPLFVFIAADEIWGTETGIYVALSFGILELGFIYFKEKRIDRFVIIDTGLLVVFGVVSILLENDIFFKLKPALIELILCAILGISAFSRNNLMLLMSKRYMKDVKFTEIQKKQFLRSLKIMFWVFLIHTLLIIYSAYFMSKASWAFISGGLFYIIFAGYFVIELIRNKMKKKKFGNEEILPLVDNEGKIIGNAPRSECHKNKELLHPVVHVHIFNSNGEIYLQKRPDNKLVQPGKWDTAVGGHISFGETLEQALKKEIREETGIEDLEYKFFAKYIWESEIETELVYVFIAKYDKPLNFKNEEIADGKFWTVKEIEKNIGNEQFTPNFEYEFKLFKNKKNN